MQTKIVVVGSMNMDLVTRSPRIPAPGETLLGNDFRTVPGGKGANQAVAAARMGAEVSMVGRLGNDTFAGELRKNLEASGVDHTLVGQSNEFTTGIAVILVADDGENSIVLTPGSNMSMTVADVDAAEGAIAAADALLLQLEIPQEAVVRAAQIARRHGTRVILNPAPAQPMRPDLFSLVDVLIPNEHEAALLAGMPVDDQQAAVTAAAKLRDQGAENVIITLGSRGALLATAEKTMVVPAFAVEAVDTTAAGDAFIAGFSVALAEGRSLEEAVRWGSAAGALAATQLGAQPSLPDRSAVLELLASASTH